MENNSPNTGVIISQFCDYTKNEHVRHFQAVNHTVCVDSHSTGYLLGESERAINGYQFSLKVARQGPRVDILISGQEETVSIMGKTWAIHSPGSETQSKQWIISTDCQGSMVLT